jgi:hypothetical protein
MNVFRLLAGALLLLLGRRLFWLFVGLMGFAAGLPLANRLLPDMPEWMTLAVAVGVGLLGALLAVFLQRLAIGIAGFLAGALAGSTLAASAAANSPTAMWVGIILGGILGAILLATVFDLGLMALSSFVGASLIVDTLHLAPETAVVAMIVLFPLGLAFQSFGGRKAPVEG